MREIIREKGRVVELEKPKREREKERVVERKWKRGRKRKD